MDIYEQSQVLKAQEVIRRQEAEDYQSLRAAYKKMPFQVRYQRDPRFHQMVEMMAGILSSEEMDSEDLMLAIATAQLINAERKIESDSRLS